MTEELKEQISEIEKLLVAVRRMAPALWVLIVGAFSLGIWVTTIQLKQLDNGKKIERQEAEQRQVALWKERTEANRFTSKQGVDMQRMFVEALNNQDKRLQKTETAILNIEKSLQRIESKLP